MRRVYNAEELGADELAKVQDEARELGWTMTKTIIPFRSVAARRQWSKNAEEWLSDRCVRRWFAIAYLDDAAFYARFERSSDAAVFDAASGEF